MLALRRGQIPDRAAWAIPQPLKHQSIPKDTRVMCPSTHDITPANVVRYEAYLLALLKRGNEVLIVSKPHLNVITRLLRTLDHRVPNAPNKVEFRFSITSATDTISRKFEPGAPLPTERVACLRRVIDAGYPASVSMEPYLEDPDNITFFLSYAGDVFLPDLREFWIGAMNYDVPVELAHLYAPDFMDRCWRLYAERQNARFKDSYQKVLHIDSRGRVKQT